MDIVFVDDDFNVQLDYLEGTEQRIGGLFSAPADKVDDDHSFIQVCSDHSRIHEES